MITFSSIYKLFQFLELYNYVCYVQTQFNQMLTLTRNPSIETNVQSPEVHIKTNNKSQRLRIYLMTFNMNRKSQLLNLDTLFPNPEKYDIIIVGGQEAKMLQKGDIILQLANHLGNYQFMTIHHVQMWEMFLVGFMNCTLS